MKGRKKVFLVDDDELIIAMLTRALKKDGYEVRSETRTDDVVGRVKGWAPDVVMLDINLPGRSGIDILQDLKAEAGPEVIMLTADDTAETAVKAMKLGAADYLTKPFNIEEVKIVIGNIVEKGKLKSEVQYLRGLYCETFKQEIIGESAAVRDLKARILKMAESRVPTILISGESGTGKELVARYLHRLFNDECEAEYSPFVAVNCTALPDALLESELFGYEKGAFTDAKSEKKGLFEQAQGGTLLLDEVGIMKQDLQSKLLRVLEERAVRRIGGKFEVPVEVTVMGTTNRDLSEAVRRGDFRLDLFYRLNAFALSVPSLRERKDDIPLLARHFLSLFRTRYKKETPRHLSPEAEAMMLAHDWPGNVRELKNMMERIVVLESGEVILPEHLPKEVASKPPRLGQLTDGRFILPDEGISLEEVEKDLIMQALDKAKSNKTLAAKLLKISYDTLRYQTKKYGLD